MASVDENRLRYERACARCNQSKRTRVGIVATRDQHFFDPAVLAFASVHGLRIIRDDQLLEELRAAQP